MARATCYVCRKAGSECICATVPRIANRIGIHVLQHPRERWHAIGTARLIALGLERGHVETPFPTLTASDEFRRRLPPSSALLYPRPDARDLGTIPADERPAGLVLLDGTWSQAHALYRHNPWLAELPCVRFTPPRPSEYRIRREPKLDYVSTVEAAVTSLRLLEPETPGIDGLMAAFRGMIDRQIEHARRGVGRAARRRPRPITPPALVAQLWPRVVIATAEVIAAPTPAGRAQEVVVVAAIRPATGATFYRRVRPRRGVLHDAHPRYFQLDGDAFASAPSLAEITGPWRAFLGDDALVTSWNASTLAQLADALPFVPAATTIKSLVSSTLPRGPRHLEELAAILGIAAADLGMPGRAGTRLGLALAALEHVRRTRGGVAPT